MDTSTHDTASVPTGGRSELPTNAEVFALGLEDDNYLYGPKILAGALSAVALIAMLVTSLFRAPAGAWTVLLAVIAAGLIVAMSRHVIGRRADRRR